MTRGLSIFIRLAVLGITGIGCVYAMGQDYSSTKIPIRVLIVNKVDTITFKVEGKYKMLESGTKTVIKEGMYLHEERLKSSDISDQGIEIVGSGKSYIYINGRPFRGDIRILKEENKIMVVNEIDVEDYLMGVLYHEMAHYWPVEALKAQAIAARTYAIYQKVISKKRYYDVTSDVYSQVYGGRRSETWRTSRVINQTRRLVMLYNGKLFPAYYHATCGGRTTDAVNLWGIDIEPLKGRECGFCNFSPHFRWKKELALDTISERLREAGYDIKDIVSIDIIKRDESGRILELELKGKDGSIRLDGNRFRLIIGPNLIKSTNFEIDFRSRFVTFYGKGWGHGVGMCQWGAYGMARKGYKAEEILKYYYPGVEIVELE